jgi:hypothetical protein
MNHDQSSTPDPRLIVISTDVIRLRAFHFRQQPLFDYVLFDPVDDAERRRLIAALLEDRCLAVVRQLVRARRVDALTQTFQVGRTAKGEPILVTHHAYRYANPPIFWFAGVCLAPARSVAQYLDHVPHRIAATTGVQLVPGEGENTTIMFLPAERSSNPEER